MTVATTSREIVGRLCCRPGDPLALWLLCDDGRLVGLCELLSDWVGHQVRVITADGKDRRWVVMEEVMG